MKLRHILAFSAAIAAAGTVISAQTPGWAPVLEVRAESAGPAGDRASTSATLALAAGQPASNTFIASANLCMVGGGPDGYELRATTRPDIVWKVSASLVGADASGYRVRVTSQFDRVAVGAPPAPWTDELLLKEGEFATVETLRATAEGACHVRNVTIRARVVLRATDAAAKAARYTADAWLVHTDAAGVERRQHVTTTLGDAGPVSFAFDPMGFALPQLNSHQGDLEAFFRVIGSLRAKVRPDGQIDLDVSTAREIGLRHPSDPPGEMRGNASGRKGIVLKEDETVAIDLPGLAGMAIKALTESARFNAGTQATVGSGGGGGIAAAPGQAPAPRPAVSVKDDRMTVNFNDFFKGQKTQLIVRLRKARE